MKKFNLGQIDEDYLDKVGGKARGLDRLIKGGFLVPDGVVLYDVNLETDIENAVSIFEQSGLNSVAVRSSASNEDGEDFSFAGQFATVLFVEGKEAFKNALIKCVNSLSALIANSYEKNLSGKKEATMSVVVQSMIEPSCAGVCFTKSPQNSEEILVEAVEGIGEALVSGEKAAVQYSVKNENELGAVEPPLTGKDLFQIVKQANEIQTLLDSPQDLEWGICDGKLFWLQTRPITTDDTATEDEFNFTGDIEGHATTKFNIGEMLPGAVTPLSLSTTVYAIDWGIRKMLQIIGANKKMLEVPKFGCVFSSHGHLFMNLTQLYKLAKTTFLAGKKNIDLSICDRELVGEEEGITIGKKKWFIPRLFYSLRYISFIMSYKKAIKKIDKLAEQFKIDSDGTVEGLYNAIDKSLDSVNYAALLHYVTSGHGGAMSSAVTNALDKKIKNSEKSRSILAQMLERIDGIESADILDSLVGIAKIILQKNPSAKDFSLDNLREYLQTSDKDVKEAVAAFMDRHGHRAIREAELRNKGWASDEDAFVKYLKTVLNSTMPEGKNDIPPPDLKKIAVENGFKGASAGKLVYFAKQARKGVVNREFSKAKLIKIFDVLKL
ncbi:MAG: hypothetical protein FWC82_03920, partial [Firmicutes bacterium]|nr:hypothetical protein [Bacillota bacterium]